MKTLVQRPCPICASRHGERLHHQAFALPEGHPLSFGYDVVCCEKCAFVYADTTVSQADYDRFYATFSKYEDNLTGTGGGATPWDEDRLHSTAMYISRHLPDGKARILDMGCANGGLLRHLRDLGFSRLVGVDPSIACVANTVKLGIEASRGTFGGADSELGRFDCVIVSHVLEHVQDLGEAVRFLRDHLTEGGVVYAEVPDAARYGEFLFAPFQDFNTEHINHFSPALLDALLVSFGLTPVTSGTKTFLSSPNSPYPAAFGLWRRSNGDAPNPARSDPSIGRDEHLRVATLNYIAESQRLLGEITARIDAGLGSGMDRPVVIWGTGQLTMKLLVDTSLRYAKVLAFIDGNPSNWGKIIHGVPVQPPEKLSTLAGDVPILIGSMLHHDAIADRIRSELRIPNPLILLRDSPPNRGLTVAPSQAA